MISAYQQLTGDVIVLVPVLFPVASLACAMSSSDTLIQDSDSLMSLLVVADDFLSGF